MVNLLDRYLVSQFLRNIFLVLAAFTVIYLLVDFFERIDNFYEAGKSTSLAFQYFALRIPEIVEQLMPICILLAGILTLGLLSHQNELIALQAGGIGVHRIMMPILGAGFCAALAVMAAGQWLMPVTVAAANRIWFEDVQQRVPKGIYRYPRFYYKGQEGFYTYKTYDPHEKRFENFSYSAWDENHLLVFSIYANIALWQKDGGWSFDEGQLKEKQAGGDFAVSTFARTTYALPDTPEQLFIPEYREGELSLVGLYKEAQKKKQHGDLSTLQKFHYRLSYIFLGLPLLLAGLPIVLIVHRRWGRDLSLAIPASCVLAFLAWFSWGTLQSFAGAAYLHPIFAAWVVHFLVGGMGIFTIRQQAK